MELSQLLQARENRAQRQRAYLEQYRLPLVCFTMNIAGPVKNSPLITKGFQLGDRLLRSRLPSILLAETKLLPTGCEGYYVAKGAPEEIKALCTQIEESLPVGRLFDLDVIAPREGKLSRPLPRKCLICNQDARICARSRSHPLSELQSKTEELLTQAMEEELAERIGCLANQSLLYELCTTPKPGLVDCRNSGSHRDMDLFTFIRSASVLTPYFKACGQLGISTRRLPHPEVFSLLRPLGREAEAAMYQATQGVNTHKGAIFSMGLLCAAAGRVGEAASAQQLCEECSHFAQGLVARELSGQAPEQAKSKGEVLYHRYGLTGIRGQAEAGFPAVLQIGLPVLKQGLALGLSRHRSGCAALLAMLQREADTCLISRSSPERYKKLQEELTALLAENPYPDSVTLEALDDSFIREQLSPGGAADLLSLAYFLLDWEGL